MSQKPDRKFPILALLIGGVGTVAACLGILAYSAPAVAARIWPLLAHSTVADALIAMGAVFIALEMILILQWVQRRRGTHTTTPDIPVVRTRGRS